MSARQLVRCAVDSAAIGAGVDVESGLAAEGEGVGAAADGCDGYRRITVKDTGAGLTAADQQKLFKQVVQFRYAAHTHTITHACIHALIHYMYFVTRSRTFLPVLHTSIPSLPSPP